MYYIAQVFGALGWLFLLISYWKTGSKKLLYFQLIACVFFAINYGILGATAGIIIVIFEIIRDSLYIKVKEPMKIFLLTIPFYILIALIPGNNFMSLFSILASLIDSYALTRKNDKVVALSILTYSLWIIYDISYQSYGTVIAEAFLIISNIIVLTKYKNAYYKSDKLSFSRGMAYNSKVVDELHKLNKNNFDSDFTWPKEKLDNIIKSNKTDFIIIHDEDSIIGYINFIIINEKKYKKILSMDVYKDINHGDISFFGKNKLNYININKIAIKNNYQNKKTIKLISDKIFRYLSEVKNKGYIIDGIVSVSVNDFDKSILELCNFSKQKETEDFTIYTLNKENLDKVLEKDIR